MSMVSVNLPIGSLDAYIQRVNQIPLLTEEQEMQLAHRFQNDGDIEGARQLVLAHLRYVVRIARGYMGYGLALGDLIQEGNVGLMKAVKRFDPNMGVRLVSFAVHWIKSEIHEFVIRNWRIVKIATTKAQRKLFFNLRQLKTRLGWMTKEEVNSVADDLGVTPAEVLHMEQRLNAMDTSFDIPEDADEEAMARAPVNYLCDEHADPAKIIETERMGLQAQDKLSLAFERLDERSRDILEQRWLTDDKATLHDLAEKYSVSAERVRQLEQNAMKKLKTYMEAV